MKKVILWLFLIALLPLSGCGTKQAEKEGTLTVAAFMDSEYLRAAAKKYEETHEGVTINITAYAGEEKNLSKYSQIINTALMSGKGEDIIDVSSITWTKLADKNKLLDLGSLINLDSSQYYQNVLDAFAYKGKRYTVPMCFMFEALQFDDTVADNQPLTRFTMDELLALSNKCPEAVLFNGGGMGMSASNLAYKLFCLHYKNFLDIENKQANVDNAQFISLLENIQSLSGRLEIKERGDTSLIRQYILYSPVNSSSGTLDYTKMFLMTNEDGQANFETADFLPAINANSKRKELAADFLKFLLSEDAQTSPELTCCPVNKKAASALSKLVLGDVAAAGNVPGSFDMDKNTVKFNELAGQLALVSYTDQFILNFVLEEMNRFFQGEESAEQAAKNLQSRLNTYLKE